MSVLGFACVLLPYSCSAREPGIKVAAAVRPVVFVVFRLGSNPGRFLTLKELKAQRSRALLDDFEHGRSPGNRDALEQVVFGIAAHLCTWWAH